MKYFIKTNKGAIVREYDKSCGLKTIETLLKFEDHIYSSAITKNLLKVYSIMEIEKCPLCGEETKQKGMGEYDEKTQLYEWYQSDHKCPRMGEASRMLGALGGKMTKMLHGKKHFSEAGKKGMARRWGTKHVETAK